MTVGPVIRKAETADARAMIEARHASIREKAGAHYPAAVLAAWSPDDITEQRVVRMEGNIASEEFYTLVAEDAGDIIGFGQINPGKNVLGAVYVRKNRFGGVGERLLNLLLQHAREQGCKFIAMDASTNAEAFYRRHGFRVTGYGKHHIKSAGIDMDCVHMMLKLE
ncbi:MAG TPA: GNAT family N-acetyltransferase [Patescibacteria group bacterium]|nr:GNAT family N-acetyltransferase [Patescibacteria group bacterium]